MLLRVSKPSLLSTCLSTYQFQYLHSIWELCDTRVNYMEGEQIPLTFQQNCLMHLYKNHHHYWYRTNLKHMASIIHFLCNPFNSLLILFTLCMILDMTRAANTVFLSSFTAMNAMPHFCQVIQNSFDIKHMVCFSTKCSRLYDSWCALLWEYRSSSNIMFKGGIEFIAQIPSNFLPIHLLLLKLLLFFLYLIVSSFKGMSD